MTQYDRLLRASHVMQAVIDMQKPFDMRLWYVGKDPSDCKTAACFIGWCCRDTVLRAEGLAMGAKLKCPVYNDRAGTNAVEDFFGITDIDAIQLIYSSNYGSNFYSDKYVTPTEVLTRLNKLLLKYKQPSALSA